MRAAGRASSGGRGRERANGRRGASLVAPSPRPTAVSARAWR
eukprot:CAMPEP_0183402528 /NCGR_PEP_ID=MMETSP0370-20130417/13962_1 /TAXON_ID=268820 /ORGANISM="Peridinium aciculiferum, Strain PAER-2" /LENGTH=41 /DNA_ID= /DNA_START= /DNA_END= /DNA_ORIENTATION=